MGIEIVRSTTSSTYLDLEKYLDKAGPPNKMFTPIKVYQPVAVDDDDDDVYFDRDGQRDKPKPTATLTFRQAVKLANIL